MEQNNRRITAKPYIPTEDEIPGWIRKYKGCEHYTDDEARDIYASLGTLAEILMRTDPVQVYNSNNEVITTLTTDTHNDNQNKKHAA